MITLCYMGAICLTQLHKMAVNHQVFSLGYQRNHEKCVEPSPSPSLVRWSPSRRVRHPCP